MRKIENYEDSSKYVVIYLLKVISIRGVMPLRILLSQLTHFSSIKLFYFITHHLHSKIDKL